MGEVWGGLHTGQGVRVAVKFLTGRCAAREAYRESFLDEIRRVASLAHPNIVAVFDHGEVSPELVEASGGKWKVGTPFLVMEWATRGSLRELGGQPCWEDIRLILLTLLSALGHVHARGIIHRDLKPANVLLSAAADFRPGLKLSDFGIAQEVDFYQEGGEDQPVGTPLYMAPEQLVGSWRDHGPWTDLYALGFLAFELVCGFHPFESLALPQVVYKHLTGARHLFEPVIDVPPGLGGWINCLLDKRPWARFQRAADAASALMKLDPEAHLSSGARIEYVLSGDFSSEESGSLRVMGDTVELDLLRTTVSLGRLREAKQALERGGPVPEDTEEADSITKTELPAWRDSWGGEQQLSYSLLGTGLAIYGMRTIPLVGRKKIRDEVWRLLGEVHADGSPAVAVLDGAAGVGKSCLALWCSQRAHEMGLATVLKAEHSAEGGPGHGLAAMMERYFRTQGLDQEGRRQRILDAFAVPLEVEDAEDLAAMIGRGQTEGCAEAGQMSRFAVVCLTLEKIVAEGRPAIIWLDDIHWSLDSIDFVAHAIKRLSGVPVLFLLTSRQDIVGDRRDVSELLAELVQDSRAHLLEVGPLPPSEHSVLVRQLLGLKGTLAHKVEMRTAGNPFFAVEIVGDWVRRGMLDITPDGFVLKEGVRINLPDSIHGAWEERVARFFGVLADDEKRVLELAAVIGETVDNNEWHSVCLQMGLRPTVSLLRRLFSTRLAEPQRGGWRFAHGMLRESIVRYSRDGGRLEALHSAAAAALSGLNKVRSPRLALRLAQHLVGAGERAKAITPLLEGALASRDLGDFRLSDEFLKLRSAALEEMGVGPEEKVCVEAWLVRASLYDQSGRQKDALRLAQRVVELSRRHGWEDLEGRGLYSLAVYAFSNRKPREASSHLMAAKPLLEKNADTSGLCRAMILEGDVLNQMGHFAMAKQVLETALESCESIDDRWALGWCLGKMARMHLGAGNLDQALHFCDRSLALAQSQRDRYKEGFGSIMLGQIQMAREDREAAAAAYERARTLYDSIGSRDVCFAELNLISLDLDAGDSRRARTMLDKLHGKLMRHDLERLLGALQVLMVRCCLLEGDWAGCQLHLDATRVMMAHKANIMPAMIVELKMCVEKAAQAGRSDIEDALRAMAREGAAVIGRADLLEGMAERVCAE